MPDLPQLMRRDLQFRSVDTEDRAVEGIAVPWDDEITIWGMRERFERGSIVDSDGAHLFWRHDEPIGRLTEAADVDEGWSIRARFSTTQRANDAWTLAKDGVIDRFSIGFEPIEWRIERDTDRDEDVIVYTRVKVREVSLVPHPAYDNAVVTSVRNAPTAPTAPTKENPMPEDTLTLTRADLDAALREQADTTQRTIEAAVANLAPAQRDQAGIMLPYNSLGEFVRAIATGDRAALDYVERAYAGGTSADTVLVNQWAQDAIHLVEQRRRVKNTFNQAPLPSEGMTVEWAKVDQNTISVDEQAAEGDDLDYGQISIDSATSPVKTYGGYTTMSRQQIERSSVNVLDTAFRAMSIEYARRTEAAVRAFLTSAITAQITDGNSVELAATPDVYDWLDLIVDAADVMEDERSHTLAGLYVSKSVFKTLIRLETTGGDPLMNVQGNSVNVVGELDLTAIRGSMARVPVWVLPGATGDVATFFDPIAITTWESAGAPFRLQDENIINLSKDFSVYGYQSIGLQFPKALLPVEFAV